MSRLSPTCSVLHDTTEAQPACESSQPGGLRHPLISWQAHSRAPLRHTTYRRLHAGRAKSDSVLCHKLEGVLEVGSIGCDNEACQMFRGQLVATMKVMPCRKRC